MLLAVNSLALLTLHAPSNLKLSNAGAFCIIYSITQLAEKSHHLVYVSLKKAITKTHLFRRCDAQRNKKRPTDNFQICHFRLNCVPIGSFLNDVLVCGCHVQISECQIFAKCFRRINNYGLKCFRIIFCFFKSNWWYFSFFGCPLSKHQTLPSIMASHFSIY